MLSPSGLDLNRPGRASSPSQEASLPPDQEEMCYTWFTVGSREKSNCHLMENSPLRKIFALLLFSLFLSSVFVIQDGPRIRGVLFWGGEGGRVASRVLTFFLLWYVICHLFPLQLLHLKLSCDLTPDHMRVAARVLPAVKGGAFGDGGSRNGSPQSVKIPSRVQ